MLLRFLQTSPALAGLTAMLLATSGAGVASPAGPGQPGSASGRPGSAVSPRLALPRPGEVVFTGSAVDGGRPRAILPAAHRSPPGGVVQTAFNCDETSAAGAVRRSLAGQFGSGQGRLSRWAVLSGGRAATSPAAASVLVPARRAAIMHRLTVTGTNLAGRPVTGGIAWVFNTDACGRYRNAEYFHHGVAKFSF